MSFFDCEDNQDFIEPVSVSDSLIRTITDYPLGSMVVYNTETNSLGYFMPGTPEEIVKSSGNIPVGVVLEQLDDMSYIVLYKGCLNKETLDLTGMIYNTSIDDANQRASYLGSVIAAQFKKYSVQFKQKLCDTGLRNELFDVMLPGNRQFDIITYNTVKIMESMVTLLGEEKGQTFYDNLISRRFYCNIGGHIAVWRTPVNVKKPVFYTAPNVLGGYFLPILNLKFFN